MQLGGKKATMAAMSKNNETPSEDMALFRQTVGPVKRLKHDRVELPPARPQPAAIKRQAEENPTVKDMLSDEYSPSDSAAGDTLLFSRPGIQHGTVRKLRRGQISIGAELDLHGQTVAEARNSLGRFLADCGTRNIRAVRIIHGKGHGSRQNKPVLKGMVNRWLQQCDEVLAFCSARREDGGTGAVYVLLRRAT